MGGRRTKLMRRTIKAVMQAELEDAWAAMLNCNRKARVRLAWRLAMRREMDGSKRKAK